MEEKKKNRPHDTAFKQQRLKAWQPILTPRWVIATFFIVGLIFIPVGWVLKAQSDAVFEQIKTYDSVSIKESGGACHIGAANQGYTELRAGNPRSCSVEFTITQNISESESVQLFYQLTNFFQNHRRYVISRSDDQLRDDLKDLSPATFNPVKSQCEPSSAYQNPATNATYWPCGLIAQSYFNDGILFDSYNGLNATESAALGVALNKNGVAWASDLGAKFMNPTGEFSNNYATFEYIWQTYDQMTCYDRSNNSMVPCYTYSDIVGFPVAGSGCAACPNTAYAEYQGGIPPPGGSITPQSVTTKESDPQTPFGVRDEGLVVWMRTAGLPDFRKLYAYITPPKGGFKAGDTLKFRIVPNFEVTSFQGSKSLVISTVSSLGGKNNVLGIAYFSVGGVCWALALAFLVKQIVSPRKLGDTKFIVWRQRGS